MLIKYLKGLSLVPSSEGFTITAFLPAYLPCTTTVSLNGKSHIYRKRQPRNDWRDKRSSPKTKRQQWQQRQQQQHWTTSDLPESSRTTLPPFMIFPITTSERNSTLRSHLNQDFNGIPSKTLRGSESDKITFICPSLTWSSSGRTPAPSPGRKTV